MKFIVDRQTWYRGKGSDHSYLLTQDGMKCCIGFVGQQCKVPNKDLQGFATVLTNVLKSHSKFPEWMKVSPMRDNSIGKAYEINDDKKITDAEREAKLKALFLANGDEIEFIN